ncbi:MAG: hypothetical protein ABI690_29670 [Chloroflexota bacterium]
MIRSYLKLIPTFALIFLALTLAARALGTTQPPNPALRGFTEGCEDKPQPCWYGIMPGITTVREADHILKDMGYTSQDSQLYFNEAETLQECTIRNEIHDTVIRRITLNMRCLNLQLGTVMSWFGKPDGIGAWRVIFEAGLVNAVVIYHGANHYELLHLCMDFDPNGRVEALELYNPQNIPTFLTKSDWRGNLSYIFYVRRYKAPECASFMTG